MPKFIADLHVHSRFSRATAKNLDLENLYIAAQLKGISVVGSGDFTHPGWFEQICEKLVPAEPGLFRLKPEIASTCDSKVPPACRRQVRFMLQTEISNIYKKGERTRKNHNLIFMPTRRDAQCLNAKLDRIGNIISDGRPILGLDARNLLEIQLETSSQGFFIPAHIWTPWFSVLGSKSGFDSVDDCFGDLTSEIFAVETGLSSDPAMNWRISALDAFTLVSNSDAHSPLNLGREANIFNTELSFDGIKKALKSRNENVFLGTIEFYPQEGKYHFDGHRKCGICLNPSQSQSHGGCCPQCGKPLTLGVLYRVEELADRPEGFRPQGSPPYHSLVPLTDLLADIFKLGPKTKTVARNYRNILAALGPELEILLDLPLEDLDSGIHPLFKEAVQRMRRGQLQIEPGYDGEYGRIKIFEAHEHQILLGQRSLFAIPDEGPSKMPGGKSKGTDGHIQAPKPIDISEATQKSARHSCGPQTIAFDLDALNSEQRKAVLHAGGPLIVVAGPGTGKTRVLTHRIAHLVDSQRALADNILAMTFTHKAAQEMRHRLDVLTCGKHTFPWVGTFHFFCHRVLSLQNRHTPFGIVDEQDRILMVARACAHLGLDPSDANPSMLAQKISVHKQNSMLPGRYTDPPHETLTAVMRCYQHFMDVEGLMDFEDLILGVVLLLENDRSVCRQYQRRFEYIFIDEYQDLNYGQYRIVRALTPADKSICVIGDPDQSIYGFRGSDPAFFKRFQSDFPSARSIFLKTNYRSTPTIVKAAMQILPSGAENVTAAYGQKKGYPTIDMLTTASEKAEAVAVGKTIERLVGGFGIHSVDLGRHEYAGEDRQYAFSDIAVLFRTGAQIDTFADVFEAAGIPCQTVRRERIFNRPIIKALISLLKISYGHGSFLDFERVLTAVADGIGPKTVGSIQRWCYRHKYDLKELLYNARRFPIEGLNIASQRRLDRFLGRLKRLFPKIEALPVKEQLNHLMQHFEFKGMSGDEAANRTAFDTLLNLADQYDRNHIDFLAAAGLQTDPDTYDEGAQKVALLTMHSAKGLEFSVVFIAGCEKGLIPFTGSGTQEVDLNEERRLFYVAMTRAKERLLLSWTRKRRVHGKHLERQISPFTTQIEATLVSRRPSFRSKTGAPRQAQIPLFPN